MISPGSLIEFIDGGTFFCGLVAGVAEKKIQILGQNGREISLPEARVLSVSRQIFPRDASRETITTLLRERCAGRLALAEAIDLEPLWEIVCEESDNEFSPDFLSEMHFGGMVDDDQRAAFLRAVFADPLFFKYKNGKIVAHTPEQVEHLRRQRRREQEKARIKPRHCANGSLSQRR